MQIDIPSTIGVALTISDQPMQASEYPTRRLMKGIVMSREGLDLTEEAVGFGVPVVKRGIETFFPGSMELIRLPGSSIQAFTARYKINLVERIMQNGRTMERQPAFYGLKNLMAAMIRNIPLLRKPLTQLSLLLRAQNDWETTYIPGEEVGFIEVAFGFSRQNNTIEVGADLSALSMNGITEVILMNEQGGNIFDRYHESNGVHLEGTKIGAWDEVFAEEAAFASSTQGIAFSIKRIEGTRLFRGRELIDKRLAWSGFGISVPPTVKSLNYTIKLESSA